MGEAMHGSVLRHLQHQLAKVFSVEQLEQRLGEGVNAHHDVFLACQHC